MVVFLNCDQIRNNTRVEWYLLNVRGLVGRLGSFADGDVYTGRRERANSSPVAKSGIVTSFNGFVIGGGSGLHEERHKTIAKTTISL